MKKPCVDYKFHQESELSGPLYAELLRRGIDAHLELGVTSSLHRSEQMRVDIGILDDGFLIAAIEVKRRGKKMRFNTRQAAAYRGLRDTFGVSIHFVNCDETAAACIEEIEQLLRRQHGDSSRD